MWVFLSDSARGREGARLLGGRCDHELDTLSDCDCLVLPIPLTRDGTTVLGVTKGGRACTLEELADWLREQKSACTVAYAPHPALEGLPVRYLESDECFMRENARLTAEGALSLLLSSLEGGSLADCSVFVLGYGRIARALLPMLSPLAGEMTVYARRASALRAIRSASYRALPFSSLAEKSRRVAHSEKTRLLVNTVPSESALEEAIHALSPSILLELACTRETTALAEAYGASTRVLSAPAMPSRYAPLAAGHVLADACLRLSQK